MTTRYPSNLGVELGNAVHPSFGMVVSVERAYIGRAPVTGNGLNERYG